MMERFRLFVFGVENGLVLFIATAFVVVVGLIGVGYWTLHGFTPPSSIAAQDALVLIENAASLLNTNNTWSNVFFLAAQTCLVFVAVHLTKYLYGRSRIIANVRKNVQSEVEKARSKVAAVQEDETNLQGQVGITYLKELNDQETGLNPVRDHLTRAIDACELLDAHCRSLADYLSKLDIQNNLLEIAAASDASAEALRGATGLWRRDKYLGALGQGKQIFDHFMKIKLELT
jgi:hypothetical protein